MYVNNEIGVIQPIKEIGKIIEKNSRSYKLPTFAKASAGRQAISYKFPIFHTDAVQAIQFLEPRLDYLKVDVMTVSAHKIYGPKGAGALIAKKRVPLTPLLLGGGQEFEMRSGTLNVPAIVGLGKAIELLHEAGGMRHGAKKIEVLKKRLKDGILRVVPNAKIVSQGVKCAPHILNVIFQGIEAQVMLIALDQEGIAVSSGAACSTKAIQPSHVLLALGYSEKDALSSIRFSLGRYTSEEEIERTVEVVGKMVKRFKRKKVNS